MKQIILLHGAIGAQDQLSPLASQLTSLGYQVFKFSFSGHGKTPFNKDFSIQQFSNELELYIKNNRLNKATVFGYSMGGYVALYLALQNPELIEKIITLGTKFYWDEAVAQKEIKLLNPQTILEKVPKFAEQLQKRHGEDWQTLLKATEQMMLGLGKENVLQISDFKNIKQPTLIGIADNDTMVSIEETTQVFQQLPQSAMFMLPFSKHPIEQVNIHLLAQHIDTFIHRTI